jgi:4-oxalocrotonate tautomerase
MPIIQIHLLEGRDVETKRVLARKITDIVAETIGKEPSRIRIIFSDMATHDYAIAGTLICDGDKG